MCWFSAEHANHIEEAKAGQRLGIRAVYPHSHWAVSESELESRRPAPVCLLDGTQVLFRISEGQQALPHFAVEAVAVFRMLEHPKRDVFEFSDGRQLTVDELPAGVIFDVLTVPGLEHLSAFLEPEPVAQKQEKEEQQKEREPFLARLMARL